jgi:hypothetical protein
VVQLGALVDALRYGGTMAESLRNWGLAILVFGATLFVMPHLGLPNLGPPNLGMYMALGGGALFVIGRLVK